MNELLTWFWRLSISMAILGHVLGCAPRPYQVCSDIRCTPPLTHEETVRANEVKTVWGEDAPLHVEIAP